MVSRNSIYDAKLELFCQRTGTLKTSTHDATGETYTNARSRC